MVCDLNGRQLEYIYTSIKQYYGDEAAKNFVAMVADLPVLSATDFLLALYRLEAEGWKWNTSMKPRSKGISFENEGEALCSVTQALANLYSGNSTRDETYSIRGNFLEDHKAELPKEMQFKLTDRSPWGNPWGDRYEW